MKASKGNKEYVINGDQVKAYQDSGFDVKDDDGNMIAYGKGKTVPYETYMAVVKEKEDLQKQIEDLQKQIEDLQKENAFLKEPSETAEKPNDSSEKAPSKKAGE